MSQRSKQPHPPKRSTGPLFDACVILLPLWVLGCLLLAAMTPTALRLVRQSGVIEWLQGPSAIGPSAAGPGSIAAIFTREVRHWGHDIDRWAAAYGLDPNLVATVMQIESCGHPTVVSSAGAQGLFQVMPYHFTADEHTFDPDTNAARGMGVLTDCLARTGGDFGRAMACYNGGPATVSRPIETWAQETQDYYIWATGIQADLQAGYAQSPTLMLWLEAGGASLCRRAALSLGLE